MKQKIKQVWHKLKRINKPVLVASLVLIVAIVATFSYSPLRTMVANLVGPQADEDTTTGEGISITPNSGPLTGGTAVKITGSDFNATTKVYFDLDDNGQKDDGEECRYMKHLSTTEIDCITPPGKTVGAKDLRIASRTIPNIMQATDQTFCKDMVIRKDDNPGAVVEIEDVRNGQKYPVARLADGNCWMLGSLKIDNYAATALDTDLNEGVVAQNGFFIPEVKAEATDAIYPKVYFSLSEGNLYNFVAATANISIVGNFPSAGITYNNSICPLGWRLPAIGDAGTLTNAMSDLQPDKNYRDNFKADGLFNSKGLGMSISGRSVTGANSYEYYWTNRGYHNGTSNYPNALYQQMDDGRFTSNTSFQDRGLSIRCILR